MTKSKALLLLREAGCDENLIKHSIAVSKLASKIAKKLKFSGYDIDLDFVEIAALLHDIGRSKTHSIKHGIEGAKILRRKGLEKFAKVCERHIGAGISKEEASSLGMPKRDFIPKTLEEKIIAHADNLISGDKEVDINETIAELKKELGKDHPAVLRVALLAKEINELLSKSK
ncbi:MAG: TIGR00295 family protein [Candidatus Altiarchaeota archaeon]